MVCSKCAFGFNKELKENLNELFYVKESKEDSSAKRKKSGPAMDSEIFCNELESNILVVSDWLREVLVSAIPYSLTAKEDCDSNCGNYKKAVAMGQFTPESEAGAINSPFSKLKSLKETE